MVKSVALGENLTVADDVLRHVSPIAASFPSGGVKC
jgi:hypothetical protein